MSTEVKTTNAPSEKKDGKIYCYIQLGLSAVAAVLSAVTLVITINQKNKKQNEKF